MKKKKIKSKIEEQCEFYIDGICYEDNEKCSFPDCQFGEEIGRE